MYKNVEIAFFDMDYTVLENDCDVLWKNFLVDEGLAPASARATANHYVDLYHRGELPIAEYMDFQWREFKGNSPATMLDLSQRHFQTYICQYIYPGAVQEIDKFRAQAVPVVLLTGTNRVIASPVARALDTDLIATDLEIEAGIYTGRIAGRFLIKENKLLMAREYCQQRDTALTRAAYYADSINDVELLEKVAQATVVNPRGRLDALARIRNWRIVRWSLDAVSE
jgi:HAD superfamily hydrolase (TIGR01490 family)